MTISMQLLFFELGALNEKVFARLIREIVHGPMEVAFQVGSQAGEYSPLTGGLDAGLELLFGQKTLCLSIKPDGGEIKWILLFSPNALESEVAMWHAIFEARSGSCEPLFTRLKNLNPEYVAVAKDEPFNLTEVNLQAAYFPWTSPRFVAAALRDKSGTYVDRPPAS